MAISQCSSQRLKARDVTRQFEYSQDSQNPENLRSFRDVLERVCGGEKVEADADEEGEDAEQVDDVQEGGEEGELVRRHQQPHLVFNNSYIVEHQYSLTIFEEGYYNYRQTFQLGLLEC